jgi:hypothetical protein
MGFTALAAGGFLAAASPALATESTSHSGQYCMQKVFSTPVSSANKLNCSANDIRLSKAVSASPSSCTRGTRFNLTATFETIVTANARYDAGFFFRTDGGANARGDGTSAAGQCVLTGLRAPPGPNPPALNLDGDTSGDLNAGTYLLTLTIPDVACEDSDDDGKLNLPNCTSWHSNQGTFSSLSDPFTFNPDTKSKCVCDDSFEVPVTVEEATLSVTKTPNRSSIPEPGGAITYTVVITNTASLEAIEIRTIKDDKFGDKGTGTASADNTCPSLIGTTLAAQASATCSFKDDVWGQANFKHTNTVTVEALQPSISKTIRGSASADVTIDDAWNEPTLDKTALSTANCQVDATYQVVVTNNSEVDRLTVNTLSDDKFGNIATVQGNVVSTGCSLPQTIDTNGNYTCQFVGRIKSSSCDISHTNLVTAGTTDDDGRPYTKTASALVVVEATP